MPSYRYQIYTLYNNYYITTSRQLSKDDYKLILDTLNIPINLVIDENSANIYKHIVEVGPKKHINSPWCSNVLQIYHKIGLNMVIKIEKTNLFHKDDLYNNDIYDELVEDIYNSDIETYDNETNKKESIIKLSELSKYDFDKQDIEYYNSVVKGWNRDYLTECELHDLLQSNSEHSRHWYFKSNLGLFDLVKKPLKLLKENDSGNNIHTANKIGVIKHNKYGNYKCDNSLIAFSDNSSAIRGYHIKTLIPYIHCYKLCKKYTHLALTAETHNFPTGIEPFSGATTGVGGRIRDNQSIGRGGGITAGIAGYCVGDLWSNDNNRYIKKPIDILINASNGASDYGNKIGEPMILGFTRSFRFGDVEWIKPIMFSAGIGYVFNEHLHKNEPEWGMLIVKLGGPAFRIGMGGSNTSSYDQYNDHNSSGAVQRGDPEMENKLNHVIRTFIELGYNNPIESIHDQGAGGTCNVTKEIIYGNGDNNSGGKVWLSKIIKGDNTMTNKELWIAEYQEQNTILIQPSKLCIVKDVCERENLPMSVIGYINHSGKIEVNGLEGNCVVDMKLNDIMEPKYQKTFNCSEWRHLFNDYYENDDNHDKYLRIYRNLWGENFLHDFFEDRVKKIFKDVSVGSKRFLINKVDRSVSGLIAQQQCVGPYHTPISNYAIVALSHYDLVGGITAIGEKPILSLIDPGCMARMCVGELLTNIMFAGVTSLKDIKCSANWMWPAKEEKENYKMKKAVEALSEVMCKIGISIDGGKDSLSMRSHIKSSNKNSNSSGDKIVKSPGTLVLTGYCTTNDITRKITPCLKKSGNALLYINMNGCRRNVDLGGSVYLRTFNLIDTYYISCPDLRDCDKFVHIFDFIQKHFDIIYSGHDISDGGLITTLCEMSISSGMGININYIDSCDDNEPDMEKLMFSEDLGIVVEVEDIHVDLFKDNCDAFLLGHCCDDGFIKIKEKNSDMNNNADCYIMNNSIDEVRSWWESTSFELEKKQCNVNCVKQEMINVHKYVDVNKYMKDRAFDYSVINEVKDKPLVIILRDEGSNGEREMASAFHMAGFDVHDFNMNDLLKYSGILSRCKGIAFVGGFSYSDVLGASSGWHNVIKYNEELLNEFKAFYNREDTFSFGVCNGCQLMSKLGFVNGTFVNNDFRRFESRFSYVKINYSDNYGEGGIFFKDMNDSLLGVWNAHAEGKYTGSNNKLCCLKYVDDRYKPTMKYPFNPDGSLYGVAGLISENGRHFATMTHPERTFMNWQVPWGGDNENIYYGWFKVFLNMYDFSVNK